MTYQYSLNMFTRSKNALSYSVKALNAEFTLTPFYDAGHFIAMSASFFFHIYNVIANLLLAVASVLITLFSVFADDSSIDALGRGVASIFLHTLAAFNYTVNLVVTPVSVGLRTLTSIFINGKNTYGEYEELAAEQVAHATNTTFHGDAQDDNFIENLFANQ